MQFVQHENGDVIDGHRASDIRKHAREIFAHLLRMGTAPKVWGEVGLVAATYYRSEMYRQFPELRLCEQNWKVNMIATDTYSQWYRKHGPGGGGTKIVKEEDNEPETPKACGTSIAVKRESPCAGDSSEVNSMKKMKIEQAATTATVEEPSLAVASDVYVNPATFTTTSESPLSAADNSESTSMQPIAPVAAPSNADGGTTNTAVLLVNPLADLFGTPAANVGGSIISRLSHNGDAAAAAAVAAPVGCNNTPTGDGAKRTSKKSGPAKPMQLSQSTTPRNLYKCDYLKDHPNATTAEFTTVWNSLDKATKLAYKEKSVALEKLKIKSTTTVTSG
ncbi:hypothetical protein BJ138DRAFT_705412 [Hygrophoropsis aurantiaca]|uniref:Uncharacterized protein n=1 Tax=Hygrophoropsis aurantiaca TaxID=72124 RepID=A0ACB7ZXT0_9AGAM|nr:hypothetical protein BJ138DRAFT_705412 [Hygrophoropsis aurantiaca]